MNVWCQCNTTHAPFAGHMSEMSFVHLLSVETSVLTPNVGADCSSIHAHFYDDTCVLVEFNAQTMILTDFDDSDVPCEKKSYIM